MMNFEIPSLRADRLSTVIPSTVYDGGAVTDPEHTMIVWRSVGLSIASGMIVCSYTHDERFECLCSRPERYTDLFIRHGIRAVTECDYSLWVNDDLPVQLFNTYRTRWLGRYWQDHGIDVIPSLSWADE